MLIDAIDLASDQDVTTWLTVDGKRIAKIAPVDEVPDNENWVLTVPPGFLQLPESERKAAIRDRFYRNLRGPA